MRVGVQCDHRHTTGGEVERNTTGARADVEDRAPSLAGQRPPQRQILAVGAALQIVPERLEVHPHQPRPRRPDALGRTRQFSPTRPEPYVPRLRRPRAAASLDP